MQRHEGYYWVKWEGGWKIAYYTEDWWSMDDSAYFTDSYFSEINETRLLSPDEKQIEQDELIVACNTLLRASFPDGYDDCEIEIRDILRRMNKCWDTAASG